MYNNMLWTSLTKYITLQSRCSKKAEHNISGVTFFYIGFYNLKNVFTTKDQTKKKPKI